MARFSLIGAAGRSGARVPTVGVEEEFLLVDATGRPLPISAEVAARAGGSLELELTRIQVEINTPVCRDLAEVRAHLSTLRAVAAAAAARCGGRLLAVGAPLTGPPTHPITDTPRYRGISEDYGRMAAEHAVCGCHVHVEVPDRETAVQVCNHLRPWLPVLLALTANSPIHQGADTGYASWRSMLTGRWPCSGAPPRFDSAEHYDAVVEGVIGSGSVLDEKMVYWDVRPCSHLPTVEVRVADVPATVDESVLLAALVRGLVMTAVEATRAGVEAPRTDDRALRMAYWRAAHDGMEGRGVDLATDRPVPAVALLRRLLDHIRPALRETGELREVEALVEQVLAHGNGATRQRRAFQRAHAVTDVVALLAERVDQDRSPDNAA